MDYQCSEILILFQSPNQNKKQPYLGPLSCEGYVTKDGIMVKIRLNLYTPIETSTYTKNLIC
jgi:hypothetical protein